MEFGKEWQGQTVDRRFPLQHYLGGSDNLAVFETQVPARTSITKAAIKLVRANGADAETLLSNWKRAAQLSHRHLIKIFDSGRCWLSGHELLFVVSEYADENLAQVLPHRALTAPEVDAMLRPTISALAYLHDQGLVHGHVCPSNVMAVGEELKLSTDAVQAAGTTTKRLQASAYDAPELVAGQLSPAADVWSLGMMLVESFTQDVSRGKNDAAKLPEPYAEIVRHSLLKNLTMRWTVRDIADAIDLQLPAPKISKSEHQQQKPEHKKQQTREAVTETAAPLVGGRSRRTTGLIAFFAVVAILAIVLTVKLLHQGSTPGTQRAGRAAQAVPVEKEPALTAPGANSGEPGASGAGAPSKSASQAGPATQAGAVLHQVLPHASPGSLRTIHGHIKIRARVKVDASGNVSEARLLSPGPSQYFARLSLEAARQWKFTPPVTNGQASPSEWNLLFELTRGGIQAIPENVNSAK